MSPPKMLLKLMVLFVSWTSVITETSGEASATTSSNILELLKGVIAVWSQDRITSDLMKDKCPQLYSLTETEFKVGRSKGVLGSLEKLDELCPKQNSSELSLPCQGAIGISSYLCNASAGFRKTSGSADWPSPAEDTSLNQTSSSQLLCSSIQSSNLTDKLLAYLQKNPTVQAFNISSIPMSQAKCIEACDGDNLYLCRMMLQGLKTVEKWENLKDHPEDLKYSPSVEGEVAQGNDSKTQLVPEQNASNSTVQSPSTVVSQNQTTVEPKDATATVQIQKPATDDESVKKETKFNNSSNASSAAITVPQEVPSKQSAPDPKTNSTEQESRPKQETQQSPTSEAKENANTGDVQQLKPDEDDEETLLQEEKERKYEESLTDSDDAYMPDEDDSDMGMNEGEPAAAKPPPQIEESHSSPTSNEFLDEPEDTHFLVYFIVFVTLTVACYILYVRRNRFLALFIEGRNGSSSRRRSVSRPSSSGYRKLVNNLEEVITSSQSVSKSNVIY